MRRIGASTPARDNVLLVGDAAGLVDPLSGDGIYEAFASARLAAEAILAGDLARYADALAQALDHHAGASWAAKRALDRYPAVCFWAARSPGVFDVVAGLLRGDVGHPEEATGIARPAAAADRTRRPPRLSGSAVLCTFQPVCSAGVKVGHVVADGVLTRDGSHGPVEERRRERRE